MLRRRPSSVFAGGASVFPGGAVDAADRMGVDELCPGLTDARASAILGVAAGGLAFWVAAIRECFEEAGLLIARHRETGAPLHGSDPALAERLARGRERVAAGEVGLADLAREEELVLDAASMHYFAHWITPDGAPRRYDTRFFVAAAPSGQVPVHDARETVACEWIEPAEALARNERGEIALVWPTLRSLQAISRFGTAAELLEAVAAATAMVADGHGRRVVLPGDEPVVEALDV